MDRRIRIIPVRGHFEILIDERFKCSCDNETEVDQELNKINIEQCIDK